MQSDESLEAESALLDGMVLAAVALDDRDGSAARPGLGPDLARALTRRLSELAALDREARHREVRALAARLAPIDEGALPARALALLAADVPRELGSRWMAGAPPVRRGFRVDRALKATLRRAAAAPISEADELAAVEGLSRWPR